jgi:hypothetical protein
MGGGAFLRMFINEFTMNILGFLDFIDKNLWRKSGIDFFDFFFYFINYFEIFKKIKKKNFKIVYKTKKKIKKVNSAFPPDF